MAANSTSTTRQFVNLGALTGSGESTMFVDDVVGVLTGIEVRGGTYEVVDRRTGQLIQRPNSWIGHWDTPQGPKLMSWPTYLDPADGQVKAWSRFDGSINLQVCAQQRITLHMWKDRRNFYHLEVVEEEVQGNLNPMPIVDAGVAPWEN